MPSLASEQRWAGRARGSKLCSKLREEEKKLSMTYIVTEPCVGVKDTACIAVCPVDCIIHIEEDPLVYINPDECIDCGACVPECPVNAIFAEDEVPEDQKVWTPPNYDYFTMERADFLAKYSSLIAQGKEKNKNSEHANPAYYP